MIPSTPEPSPNDAGKQDLSHLQAPQRAPTLQNTVGLFGTCGNSKWRDPVIAELAAAGIPSFNPVVPHWTPECAVAEAEHLATDKVLLFVVTGETEGYGSLAETGWAAFSAAKNGQELLLVLEPFPAEGPDSVANRARRQVDLEARKAGLRVFESIEMATDAAVLAMGAAPGAHLQQPNPSASRKAHIVILGDAENYLDLTKSGWQALTAVKSGETPEIVVMDFNDGNPKSPPNRARKLVASHAEKAGVKVMKSLDELSQ